CPLMSSESLLRSRSWTYPDSILAQWLRLTLIEDGSVAKTPVSWLSLNTCGVKNYRIRCFIRLLGVETPSFRAGRKRLSPSRQELTKNLLGCEAWPGAR